MDFLELAAQSMKFFVPALFSMLFRIFGLGIKSKSRAVVSMLVFVLISLPLPYILIPIIGYDSFKMLSLPLMLLASTAVYIMSSDGFGKTTFLQLVQSNISFWISIITSSIRIQFELSYVWQFFLLVTLCTVVLLIMLRFGVKPLRELVDSINHIGLTLIAVPASIFISGVTITMYLEVNGGCPPGLSIAVFTLLEGSLMLYIRSIYKSVKDSVMLTTERNRGSLLRAELLSHAEYIDAARQSRHDLRHHNAILAEHISSGNLQQALDYLNVSNRDIDRSAIMDYCKDPTANAVLKCYERRAKLCNIMYDVRADIPMMLPLTETELGALLSNLLENAEEAALLCTEDYRFVSVKAQCDGGSFKLEVRNSTVVAVKFDRQGFPITTKVGGGTGSKA